MTNSSSSVRLSVLLPTRSGADYLPEAIASILDQTGDFELVVADNANTDETPAILASRAGDPRLRVVRSNETVPVTENWMRALRAARGEYFLMIGDDDLLLPGFFDRVGALLKRHGDPDCLTFDAYSYVAPESFSADAPALWSPWHFDMRRLGPERELTHAERVGIVRDMFRFRVRYPLNMQLTLFSRSAVACVPGDLFRAPFPDHFALNSLLLRARRVVATTERLLVIGVSPKSFGHYFYSGQQVQGLRYLGSDSSFPGRVEGSELVNSTYAWLLELRRSYPEVATIPIDRWQYIIRQVNHWYRQVEFGRLPFSALGQRARSLRWWEIGPALIAVLGYRLVGRLRARLEGRARTYTSDAWPRLRETPYRTITAFAEALSPG